MRKKTQYKPLPVDHESHVTKAEEKRARKAAKLKGINQ